jgi:hypothetical protein
LERESVLFDNHDRITSCNLQMPLRFAVGCNCNRGEAQTGETAASSGSGSSSSSGAETDVPIHGEGQLHYDERYSTVLVGATFFIEYSMKVVLIEYFFQTGFGSKRLSSKG